MKVGVPGQLLDGLQDKRDALFGPAALKTDQAQEMQRVGLARRRLENALVEGFCPFQLVVAMELGGVEQGLLEAEFLRHYGFGCIGYGGVGIDVHGGRALTRVSG